MPGDRRATATGSGGLWDVGAGGGAGRSHAVTPCLLWTGRLEAVGLTGLRAGDRGVVGVWLGLGWRLGWNWRKPVVELGEPAAGGGGRGW